MSELRDSGSTRHTLPGIGDPDHPRDDFLEAVRAVAAAEDFEVLGELGQGANLSIVYLARDWKLDRLVALRLEPGAGDEYLLDVIQQLDASVPTVERECPMCGTPPRGWRRFCTRCGSDLTGVAVESRSESELLRAVKDSASGEFEVLGEMPGAQGGGLVYFAREIATGKLVALRLRQERHNEYSLRETGALKPLAASLGTERHVPPPLSVSRPPVSASRPPVASAYPPPSAPVNPPPGPARASPPRTDRWDPVIALLRQPLFLGGILLAAILFLLIVLVVLTS